MVKNGQKQGYVIYGQSQNSFEQSEHDNFSDEKREIFWKAVEMNQQVFFRPTHLAYDDSNCLWTMEKLQLDDGGMMTIAVQTQLVRDRNPSDYRVDLKYTGAFLIDLRESVEPGGTSVAVQLIDCVTSQRLRCPLLEYVH